MNALVSDWPSRPELAMTGLRLTLIDNLADLEALVPAWQRLLEQSASPDVFLEPSWLLTWWQVFGPSSKRQLCVGMFHEGTELVGLAPLCRRRFWYRPGIPFRRLEPLGADHDEADGISSEYLNLIVRRGHEEKVAEAFARELRQNQFGLWDEFVLPYMNGDGPMPALLEKHLRGVGLATELSTLDQAVYVTLPASWEDYLKGLKGKMRKNINYWLRNFHEWAGNDFKIERVNGPEDLQAGKKILQTLHQDRWQSEGKPGVFSFARYNQFQDLYMPRALAEGKLDLHWLSVKGEPLAAIYNLHAAGKVFNYQCGRKMAVPPVLSLGKIQVIFALQEAIKRGMGEFDFLAGVMPYKLDFSKILRALVQVRATNGIVREGLRRHAARGIDALRNLRDRWRNRHKSPSPTPPPEAEVS